MAFRIILPHPLPPIINNPSESSDVLVPGQVELPSAPDNAVSSVTFTLVQTLRYQTHKPESPTSFISFGFSKKNDLNTEESKEIQHWSLSHPATSVISSTLRAIQFTVVIPGCLPATTSTPVADLSYHISATMTISTATSTTSNTIFKPLHIRRLLALPVGLTTIDYRRRFPDCHTTTLLSVPAIFRPLDACTVRLTLFSSAEYWLQVRNIHWRIEESTRIISPPPPHSEGEGGSSEEECELNSHVRIISSGERFVAAASTSAISSAVSIFHAASESERLDEVEFEINVPEKARLACTLRGDWDAAAAHDTPGEREDPPDYSRSSQYQYPTGPQDYSHGIGGRRDSAMTTISVSHTLVIEITGKEIRFDSATGEQLSLGPPNPRMYGARYEIMVSEWSHCGEAGDEGYEVPPLPEVDFGAVREASPPSYESIFEG